MAHDTALCPPDSIAAQGDDMTQQAVFPTSITAQSLDGIHGNSLYTGGTSHVVAIRGPGPALINPIEETREPIKLEIQIQNNILVTWKDVNNQVQSENNLHFDVFLDTSAGTALFRLHGDVQLTYEDATDSNQTIYLLIHPEDIQSVTLETTAGVSPLNTLCFSLQRTPHLVAPADCVLNSTPGNESPLRSIQALSTLTSFNVQLDNSGMSPLSKPDLEQIVSIFSPNHNIVVDARRADPSVLYADEGGAVVNTSKAATGLEEDPSLYGKGGAVSDMFNYKRTNLDIRNQQSVVARGQVPFTPRDILTRFNAISGGLDALCGHLDNMNSRLEKLENMSTVALDAGHNPCHYREEEREDMLAKVNRLVDQGIVDFKTECEDIAKETLKELRNEFHEAAEQLRNEAMKKMGEMED